MLKIMYLAFLLSTPSHLSAEDLSSGERTERVQGIAVDKNNQFFYTETSVLTYKKNKLEKIDINYTSEDGKLMAELHSDLKKNPYLPDIQMTDHRDQYEYKITYLPDEKKVEISLKEDDHSPWSAKKITYKENMTNSMGIMTYIHEHSADLKREKKKIFRFIIPSRQDDYGIVLEFLPTNDKNDNLLNFNFKMQNFLIRSIAGNSDNRLQFDQKNLRITHFEGISNLLDEKNHSVDVTITYKLLESKAETK